jgi:sialic acid synthase SpsE
VKDNQVYVIAEMACSHNGKEELGRQIIDGAGRAGADAIQLQIWSLADMMAPGHSAYEVCRKIELSREAWKFLADYSKQNFPEMDIYAFIYEHKSIDFAESLDVQGYKLSSADLSNPYMLDGVAATGKKINLSIGASTIEEIKAGIERIRRKSQAEITLMYGYQGFPTTIQDIHLNYMVKLKEMFGLPMGYQDHCDGQSHSAFWIPALSLGMGVSVLEKHITHDRSAKCVDWESALNPDEFENFVTMVRELEAAKGASETKPFSPEELKYRKFQKKSIVAGRALKAGEKLQEKDIRFLRAAELGLPPDQMDKILDKILKTDVAMYQPITEKDVA